MRQAQRCYFWRGALRAKKRLHPIIEWSRRLKGITQISVCLAKLGGRSISPREHQLREEEQIDVRFVIRAGYLGGGRSAPPSDKGIYGASALNEQAGLAHISHAPSALMALASILMTLGGLRTFGGRWDIQDFKLKKWLRPNYQSKPDAGSKLPQGTTAGAREGRRAVQRYKRNGYGGCWFQAP